MKRHIAHFATVSLKYFFDFDYTLCNHAFLVALVILGITRLFFYRIADELQNGIITVKEDAGTIKGGLLMLKDRWENTEFFERASKTTQLIQQRIQGISNHNWR